MTDLNTKTLLSIFGEDLLLQAFLDHVVRFREDVVFEDENVAFPAFVVTRNKNVRILIILFYKVVLTLHKTKSQTLTTRKLTTVELRSFAHLSQRGWLDG